MSHAPAKGETLPKYQRSLNMSFVAQDSFNVAQSDEMTIKVMRTGSRFALNYPRAYYTRGSTYPIYWNVANTDNAPINCTSVNVWLSLDGGQNFVHSVASNIPNNGKTFITIPADAYVSGQGRFKIKCSNNIFYAISYRNFFVTDNDNLITPEYPNEDQDESNLKDVELNSNTVTSSSTVNITANNSGGGVFNLFIYLLLLSFVKVLYYSRNSTKLCD